MTLPHQGIIIQRAVRAALFLTLIAFLAGCDVTPNIHPVREDEYAMYNRIATDHTIMPSATQGVLVIVDTTTRPRIPADDLPQNTNIFKSFARRFHTSRFGSLVQSLPDADWKALEENFMENNYVSYQLDSARLTGSPANPITVLRNPSSLPGGLVFKFSRAGFDADGTTAVVYLEVVSTLQSAGNVTRGYCILKKEGGGWKVIGNTIAMIPSGQ